MVLLIRMRWVFAHKSPSELGGPCQGTIGPSTSSTQILCAFFAVALGAAVKHSEVVSLLLLTGDNKNKASLSSPLAFMDHRQSSGPLFVIGLRLMDWWSRLLLIEILLPDEEIQNRKNLHSLRNNAAGKSLSPKRSAPRRGNSR